MWHRKITIAFCMLCVSPYGWGSVEEGMWILPVATSCLAQYPEMSDIRLGALLAKATRVQPKIDRAKAVFASNPWQGKSLCNELMQAKHDPQRDDQEYFDSMRVRHLAALKSLAERLPEEWTLSKQSQ
jgi:hypothetical protein